MEINEHKIKKKKKIKRNCYLLNDPLISSDKNIYLFNV